MELTPQLRRKILRFQRNEMTEYCIYDRLSRAEKGKNSEIFSRIAKDEALHYAHFKRMTGTDVGPDRLKVSFYMLMAAVFGVTFAIKLMERGENSAQRDYATLEKQLQGMKAIVKDEINHEHGLIGMIEEEKLQYLGSMVLAINNALEELTGVVVGLSFALRDSRMIGITALITGIAATISMAASEYLSQKSEGGDPADAAKASVYSGIMYIITVALIVGPFFILGNYLAALAWAIGNGICIVFLFSFFMSVVKGMRFRKSFLEVITITSIVVAVSYGIGTIIRLVFLNGKPAGH